MDTTDFERYAFLEEAIRYVKQHLNNIVLLLVVKMKSLLKTDDIHPPKSVISVHFFCLTCLMALQI